MSASLFSFSLSAQNAEKPPIDPNYWYRITNMWKKDGLSLAVVKDGKCDCQLELAPTAKSNEQLWKIRPTKNGWYRLKPRRQGESKCLDIQMDGKQNNQPKVGECGKFPNQLWQLVSNGNGYFQLYTMGQKEKRVLDVMNDGKNSVLLGNNQGFSGQFWKFTKVLPIKNQAQNTTRRRGRTHANTNNQTSNNTTAKEKEALVLKEKKALNGNGNTEAVQKTRNGRGYSSRARGRGRTTTPPPYRDERHPDEGEGEKTIEPQANFLKAEQPVLHHNREVLEVATPKNTLLKGMSLKVSLPKSNWYHIDQKDTPLTLKLAEAAVVNGQMLVPAGTDVKANMHYTGKWDWEKEDPENVFLEVLSIELNGKSIPVKTNKTKILDYVDPDNEPRLIIGSGANFEVPIETTIPVQLQENVPLK